MKSTNKMETIINKLPKETEHVIHKLGIFCERFNCWLEHNIDKIGGKLKALKNIEDIKDIIAELKCAAILLNSTRITDCIYEPCGTKEKSPDFLVRIENSEDIFIECKRIRRTETEVSRDEFLMLFKNKVKMIPFNFYIWISCHELKFENISENQVYLNLIQDLDKITCFLSQQLSKYNEDLENDEIIDLEDFVEGLQVSITRIPPELRDQRVHYLGSLNNIPITGNERNKFGDIILKTLPQLIDKEKNIIFILLDNDSHEYEDFFDSIYSINHMLSENNEDFFIRKGYQSIDQFINESKNIGGVMLVRRSLEGKFWINKASQKPILEITAEILRDCIKQYDIL